MLVNVFASVEATLHNLVDPARCACAADLACHGLTSDGDRIEIAVHQPLFGARWIQAAEKSLDSTPVAGVTLPQ